MNFLIILLSSLSGTALTAVLLYMFRDILLSRINKTVQHEFDKKLEEVRHQNEIEIEKIRADLNVSGHFKTRHEWALFEMYGGRTTFLLLTT